MLFNQLIYYNIHLGHKNKNTTLLASWMLFKMENNIWFIHLYKTVWFFKLIFNFLKVLVFKKSPIWFINGEMSKQYIINFDAKSCGEFYCGYIWKRGLLSNYRSMLRSIKNVMRKNNYEKKNDFFFFFKTWFLTRYSWPRGVFLSNLKTYYVISKEAFTANVPVIGMVDTNIKNYYVHLPIPSNDDSLITLAYISSLISKYILLYKYKKLILWLVYYMNSRKYRHLLRILANFNTFLKKKYIYKKRNKYMFLRKFNSFKNLKLGVRFLFKRKSTHTKFKIFDPLEHIVIDNFYEMEKSILFYYNALHLDHLKKHKLFFQHTREMQMKKRTYKYFLTKIRNRVRLNRKAYIQKWFYNSFYLFYMRTKNIIIKTYEYRDFNKLSSVSFFFESYLYYNKKRTLYETKEMDSKWFDFYKFIPLIKKLPFIDIDELDFRKKLKLYRLLISLQFKRKIMALENKKKYLILNVFPNRESFWNMDAKRYMYKKTNTFSLNLKKINDLNFTLDRELYLALLVKFISINMDTYKFLPVEEPLFEYLDKNKLPLPFRRNKKFKIRRNNVLL